MLKQTFVAQPRDDIDYSSLIGTACGFAGFDQLRAAVAYATTRGVLLLRDALAASQPTILTASHKRWLVGIDWYRSEPAALDMLSSMPRSEVRIPFGKDVLKRLGCNPTVPFHPKAYVFSGSASKALVLGSGNLSRSGLTRGHEWGSLSAVSNAASPAEHELAAEIKRIEEWFDRLWVASPSYSKVRTQYVEQYDSADHLKRPAPTDDDGASTSHTERKGTGKRLEPEFLRRLRVAQRLWIEAGNLHENRGPGKPGNQLMLTPFSRVFFGFDAADVDPDTYLGNVALQFGGVLRRDCSMRFSNNGMDVLTLPVPGHGGPSKYDRKVILFTRRPGGHFKIELGTPKEALDWRRKSKRMDGLFTMTSGRRWGVF